MCLFIETMRIEDGQLCHAAYHNARLNRTRREVLGQVDRWDVRDLVVPPGIPGRVRCRLVYGEKVEKVEYFPYQVRPVHTLMAVECDTADYAWKRADRSVLNALFERRGMCDDILIVRHGLLTDTSIANIALQADDGTWLTPARPLLAGTMRASLLDRGILQAGDLRLADLPAFRQVCLFNAMIPFGELLLPIRSVRDPISNKSQESGD